MVDLKGSVGFITFKYCYWSKLLTAKSTCWIASGTLFCVMLSFNFYNIFVVMNCVPIICSSLLSFLKDIMGSVPISLQFWLSVICASVLLKYLLYLVTLDYMLLRMVNMGYHDVFVGAAVVFDFSWSTFSICCMTTSFLYPLSKSCSISFLEWLW